MTPRLRTPHLLIPILVVYCVGCNPTPNPDIGRFEPIDCPVELTGEAASEIQVECSYVSVPERHERPEGPVIELAVARFKSTNPEAAPDPLVLNQGGPGASNLEGFFPVLASPLGEAFLSKRDVVIVELRGLYHSKPDLVCEEVFEAQLEMVGRNVTGPEANEILSEAMRRAQARFLEEGIDLPAYNNVETAADIDLVLKTLGYEQFNLFGTSAGTMVAQAVMRGYSDRLRSVIMNATVPSNGSQLFKNMFLTAASSLREYFDTCAAEEACAAAYPNIEERFFDLIASLNTTPVELEVVNPVSGEETSLVLNGDKLSSWMFASMYWNTQIVRSVDRFTKGDFTEIQTSPDIFFPMPRFSYALGYTVVLGYDPEFIAASHERAGTYRPFVDGLTLFFSPLLMEETGKLWIDDPSPTKPSPPLQSDVPALLMNGELDHVLPYEKLDELTSGLSNSHAYVFKGVAHSPVDIGDCALDMMVAFLDDPSVAPDASCMADYHHTFALPE